MLNTPNNFCNYTANYIQNINSIPNEQDGIGVGIDVNGTQTISGTATVAYNVVNGVGANMNSCGGPAGMEAYFTSQTIIWQFNEIYNIVPTTFTGGCDWDGIDLDVEVTNSLVQYNYLHTVAGVGLSGYTGGDPFWGNNIIRFNIIENAAIEGGSSACIAVGGTGRSGNLTGPVYVYNNTCWMPGVGAASSHEWVGIGVSNCGERRDL